MYYKRINERHNPNVILRLHRQEHLNQFLDVRLEDQSTMQGDQTGHRYCYSDKVKSTRFWLYRASAFLLSDFI